MIAKSIQQSKTYSKTVAETDVRSRLELFIRSMSLYADFVNSFPVFSEVSSGDFDVEQATLAFGPNIRQSYVVETLGRLSSQMSRGSSKTLAQSESSSPFAASEIFGRLVSAAKAAGSLESKRILYSVFSTLSDVTCSEDPQSYSLNWPYTQKQVKEDPYLRLRIGPTFFDLVALLLQATPLIGRGQAKIQVSKFLDAAIDSGVVVPTVGTMDERCYRIYRKGEAQPSTRVLDVLETAVEDCRKERPTPSLPYQDTHITKVVAILTFSGMPPGYFAVKSEDRGTVAVTRGSVLSDGGDEVVKALRTRYDRPSE